MSGDIGDSLLLDEPNYYSIATYTQHLLYVCIHIYMYIYIYMYIMCTYTYIYILCVPIHMYIYAEMGKVQ